ncbi:acyltransferase family protein [Acetobacter fallax]|uniref:Acyltransferase family protein n=1 Tax=Acetobacter fallax TaxID=1737473 RepID=A0ABX0K6Y6_9PROT|nr:acyltransferase [Acetobacter fallax]NHO32167.1 acyltransferase family protein [Acetobacter fallax]NHO35780.1 acyltransferase family protein [Acetobacter fallax]
MVRCDVAGELLGSEPRHYYTLDSLRGIAALTVVANHMLIMSDQGNRIWWHGAQPTGIAGVLLFRTPLAVLFQGVNAVYLFFVLSGFVLSLPWVRGRSQTYATFVIRRFFRIYPPYIAAIILSFGLLALAGHPPVGETSYWYSQIWSGPFDGRCLLAIGMMDTRNAFMDFPVWTVSWELGIGLVFPLLMMPVARYGARGLAVSAALAILIGFVLRVTGPVAAEVGRSACAYILLFLMGAGLAIIADRAQGFFALHRSFGSALGIIGVLLLARTWSDRPLIAFLPLGLGSMFLICAAISEGPLNRFLMLPVARWAGKISFSLYLIHVPIITAFVAFGRLPLFASIFLGAVVSFAVAPQFHRLIERPGQQAGRFLTTRKSKMPVTIEQMARNRT